MINTCLALLPSGGPTILADSSWSIILPALLYPSLNFLWISDVDPDWCCTTTLAASLNNSSFSSKFELTDIDSVSEINSGNICACEYEFWFPISSQSFSTSGVSINAHCSLVKSLPVEGISCFFRAFFHGKSSY